jgi:hypothetical protein
MTVESTSGQESLPEEPEALERRSWQALSAEGEVVPFFAEMFDDDVVMLLPGGLVVTGRESALMSIVGPPWESYRLEGVRARAVTSDTVLVTYAAVAVRAGQPTYSALMSSLYVRRPGGWRLAFHQQTPR